MFESDFLPILAIVGLIAGGGCFLRSFARFESALRLLVLFVIFGGIVGVNLGSGAYPIIFRDLFIVLPLYLGMFLRRDGQDAAALVPADIMLVLLAQCTVLLISIFNPVDAPLLQIAIGLKVWLFYLPFVVVGIAIAAKPELMTRLLRFMLLWGGVACATGLLQSLLVRVFGFEAVMQWFFGAGAERVTQDFGYFADVGGIYRIPGTFSFAAQYSAFLYLYLTVAVIVSNTDRDTQVRNIARLAIFMTVAAGVLSGTRAAILLFPMMLMIYAAAGLLSARFLVIAPIGVAGVTAIIAISGVNPIEYFFWGIDLAKQNGRGFIWDQISEALGGSGFLGGGIGASTGAARYAFASSLVGNAEPILKFESYFAKATAELGWFGLTSVAAVFAAVLARAGTTFLRYRWSRRNAVIAPLVVYIGLNIVSSFKGWPLDADPGNIFFWLCLGLLIGVDRLPEFAGDLEAQYDLTAEPPEFVLADEDVAPSR